MLLSGIHSVDDKFVTGPCLKRENIATARFVEMKMALAINVMWFIISVQ